MTAPGVPAGVFLFATFKVSASAMTVHPNECLHQEKMYFTYTNIRLV